VDGTRSAGFSELLPPPAAPALVKRRIGVLLGRGRVNDDDRVGLVPWGVDSATTGERCTDVGPDSLIQIGIARRVARQQEIRAVLRERRLDAIRLDPDAGSAAGRQHRHETDYREMFCVHDLPLSRRDQEKGGLSSCLTFSSLCSSLCLDTASRVPARQRSLPTERRRPQTPRSPQNARTEACFAKRRSRSSLQSERQKGCVVSAECDDLAVRLSRFEEQTSYGLGDAERTGFC
jgi:hypothetical protein